MDWNCYFETLIDWKKLPAYRLEPRIDSFLGFYLKDLLGKIESVEIAGVIPEFPIRKATIFEKHLKEDSCRVDFLAIAKTGPHYLVEVKTDSRSRRKEQDDYLQKAKAKGLRALVNGLQNIYKASDQKEKYAHLMQKLKSLSLVDAANVFSGGSEELEIIYIQPRPSCSDKPEKVICFEQIADFFKTMSGVSEFEQELSRALRQWKDD
jgi:hypothetical protein